MTIRVTITGRGYDAVSVPATLDLPDGAGVSQALAELRIRLGEAALSNSTLVIVSGRHLGTLAKHDDHALIEGDELLLLQPVAGG